MLPPRSWMERPVFVSATSSVFEAYVPPEGDGKLSALTLGVNSVTYQFVFFTHQDNILYCTGCQTKYGIVVQKEQVHDGC